MAVNTIDSQVYEVVDVSAVCPHPRNARRGNIGAIRASLDENGFYGAIFAQKSTGYILRGNHTYLASVQNGLAQVAVVWVDVDDDRALRILLADNRTSDLATYDTEALAALLSELEDLGGTGFNADDLLNLLTESQRASEIDDTGLDDAGVELMTLADELQLKWQVNPGDVFDLHHCRIACGSSANEDFVHQFSPGSARMIWTDPPYGVNYQEKNERVNKVKGSKTRRRKAIANDENNQAHIIFRDAIKAADVLPGCSLYASVPSGPLLIDFVAAFAPAGFSYRHLLVWVKNSAVFGRSDYHYQHEPILYGWDVRGPHYFSKDRKGKTSVFMVDRPNASAEHPTMKPIELVREMIENSSRPTEIVYDPFCGSGTTLLACHQTNRKGYGVELEPAFVSVILERFERLGVTPIKVAS
ncbi:MAG: DNA modification methylase [Armatimonadetes bacterium]|nr:DNA modification methylase [Armatimonadota bacterium]